MAVSRAKSRISKASKTGEPVELPRHIEPMLAQAAMEPFDSSDFLFEIKWDGTRCIALFDGAHLTLQNRREIEMRERYPELACLSGLAAGTVLDGEIIVLDAGRPSFNKLARREQTREPGQIAALARQLPATLIAFDLLYEAGTSLLARPLRERRERLSALVRKLGSPHVIAADYIIGQGIRYFQAVEEHQLEGIMAKRLDSPYLPGKRSPHWVKIKVAETGEFDILGYVPRDNEPVISALIVGHKNGSRWVFKAKVGSGFTEAVRAEWFEILRDAPALKNPPKDGPREAVWRTPAVRCYVRYFEKTPTGKLRAPVFKGLVSQK
jgi:DNA ligase D-like protein (predicted ligase)